MVTVGRFHRTLFSLIPPSFYKSYDRYFTNKSLEFRTYFVQSCLICVFLCVHTSSLIIKIVRVSSDAKLSIIQEQSTCSIIVLSSFPTFSPAVFNSPKKSHEGQVSPRASRGHRHAPSSFSLSSRLTDSAASFRDTTRFGQSCRREDARRIAKERRGANWSQWSLAATTLARVGYEYANDVNSRGRVVPLQLQLRTLAAMQASRDRESTLRLPLAGRLPWRAQAAIFRRLLPESGFPRCTNLRYFQEGRLADSWSIPFSMPL